MAEPRSIELFPGVVVTEADTMVDVGCGLGHQCVCAGSVGADVIGIENNPSLIPILEEKMRATPARSFRAILVDSETLPLPDRIADVVVCTEVVEHVRDPVAYVAELARIGRAGARYWLSVPDPISESVMKVVSPPDYFRFPQHINVFERDHFASIVEGAGLVIDQRVGVGFYWSLWWILRMACGTAHHPGASMPTPPLIAAWEALWQELQQCPQGAAVGQALDGVMPKSQVVIAHKPVE